MADLRSWSTPLYQWHAGRTSKDGRPSMWMLGPQQPCGDHFPPRKWPVESTAVCSHPRQVAALVVPVQPWEWGDCNLVPTRLHAGMAGVQWLEKAGGRGDRQTATTLLAPLIEH